MKKVLPVVLVVLFSAIVSLSVCVSALARTATNVTSLTVVLDAGHGGIDGGVVGVNGTKESEINLAIVHDLKEELTLAGLNVVLTRSTDAGLYDVAGKGFKKADMLKRKEIIEGASPVAVVSIHQNSFPSQPSRKGGQVFFRSGDERGETLANCIQNELNNLPMSERKLSPLVGDYYILNCNSYPSVICECGFLSNEEEEKLLNEKSYQHTLSSAISTGVIAFLSAYSNGEE